MPIRNETFIPSMVSTSLVWLSTSNDIDPTYPYKVAAVIVSGSQGSLYADVDKAHQRPAL